MDHQTDENGNITEYLVKWKNYPISQATWETEYNLRGAKEILTEYKTSLNQKKFITQVYNYKDDLLKGTNVRTTK